MNSVVHIAPQLPPAVDGVGDYCYNLWRHWPGSAEGWHFAVLRGASDTRRHWPEVTVHSFDPGARSLLRVLETARAETAVLHYVGYGYQPKGIPTWLPRALAAWRFNGAAPATSRRLIVMFHEMYATSSPLRSPFWVAPFARRIMRRLVRSSDAWVTSCDHYFDWLVDEFAADPARGARIPIGSNVPPAEVPAIAAPPRIRRLKLVLFGLPNTRRWALEKHAALISALVEAQSVESILVLGKRPDTDEQGRQIINFQQRLGGVWRQSYDLDGPALAAELARCDLGFVANDAGTLTKSGVFAAMAGNGVVTVIAADGRRTLGEPFRQCVLQNDNTAESIRSLIDVVTDPVQLAALRDRTSQLAHSELSWSRIATAWQHCLASREFPKAPQFRDKDPRGVPVREEVRL